MQDTVTLKGHVSMELTRPNGEKVVLEQDNLVVQVGKNYVASSIIAATSTPFTNMALGTGTNPATLSDTALQTEIARQAFSSSSQSAAVITLQTTYGPGVATGALTEAGIFNAGVAGTMLSRIVFSVVNKGTLDTLSITWTLTLS